jgi:hypothetical protein
MVGKLLKNYILSIIILSLMAGCNIQTSQEESPTQNPATAAAQTLEAVFTKVTSHTQQSNIGAETSGTLPIETKTSSPTSEGDCTNRAHFVDDITIRDNMQIERGSSFNKVWRLRNNGTCVWNRSYTLTFFGGERMGGPNSISLPEIVQPGQTIDLTLDLIAPEEPGNYQGFWRLQSGDGEYFGIGSKGDQSFWVKISVSASDDASPTGQLSPTLNPSITSSPSKMPSPSATPSPSTTPSPTTTPTPSASPQATPVVHHQGEAQLGLDQEINLDNGDISPTEGEDITLVELVTSEIALRPQNGSLLGLYSGLQRPPSIQDCELISKSADVILLSELAVNDILCYITDEGRPGTLRISALNSNIDFYFITWVP